MSDVKLWCKRLKELREHQQLTQSQLASRLNIGRASVSNYENGDRVPDADVVVKLADFFGVSADYLLGRSEFKNYGQEYDFRRKGFGDTLDLNPFSKLLTNDDGFVPQSLFELNLLMVSIDENYSSLITEIITGNERFRMFALSSLDKLLKVITFTGEYLKEYDIHDDDMYRYIKFLKKLKDTDLHTSDFGNIQATQEQIRGCTTCFNEFISFYAYSIIDFEKSREPEAETTRSGLKNTLIDKILDKLI